MPASRRTKFIAWAIASMFAVGIVWFAHGFYRAWHRFASEERTCGGFEPVIRALDEFHGATGSLPTNLTQLVPRYIQQFPAAPVADSIGYQVMPDGTNWQLTVHSRLTGVPRVFVQRSSQQLTAAEEAQVVTAFHGWRVFQE
jgi:hypothetical protein